MVDIITLYVVLVFAVACLMEGTKELVEALGKAIKKRDINVPSFVWRLLATAYTGLGAYLCQLAMIQSSIQRTPLISLFLNHYMLFVIIPITYWLQLQLDMKVVKEYVFPILKKIIDKKVV